MPVKIAGCHAGVSVGPDGATHQALEDIAITRCLPNMTVVVPCDFEQAKKATVCLADNKGPSYLRLSRMAVRQVTNKHSPFVLGTAQILRSGCDVLIVACGLMVQEALIAAKKLSYESISAAVMNMHTIKPLDVKSLILWARRTGCVVTAEEHQITGGLGGAVCEALSNNYLVPVEQVGVNNAFGQSGKPDELLSFYGLRADDIVRKAKKAILRKN